MSGTPRRPRRKPGENRALLLEAGLIEFGLLGYHGASTVVIATRADVPQPHVYTSFRTKQELFLACVELACADVRDAADTERSALAQRVLLQAIAVVRDPSLTTALTPLVRTLRADVGERSFRALLSAAGLSLLEESDGVVTAAPSEATDSV